MGVVPSNVSMQSKTPEPVVTPVQTRLEPDLLKKLVDSAKANRRSISSEIAVVLQKHYEEGHDDKR